MEYGDKISNCDCCDGEKVFVQYSRYFVGWLCKDCWERIAESVSTADDE